jgi:glutamine cyclotransferase
MNGGVWRGAFFACALMVALKAQAAVPEYGYRVVHTYPHDRTAFTEGLFYLDGFLYESTGLEGRSSIRKEKLETGEVLQSRTVPPQYFGEGIVAWKDRLISLTWQSHGWALTRDDHRLIMSDGTSELRFLDPDTLKELGRVRVTDEGRPVDQLNELEYVKGQVFANIWQTNRIARIDPNTGKVVGWIDLSGLLSDADQKAAPVDVLNGIAYDAKADRLFVTGKLWPKLFEIKLVAKAENAPKPKHPKAP